MVDEKKPFPCLHQKRICFTYPSFYTTEIKKDAVADPGEERFSASGGPIHPSDRIMQS